MRTYRFAKDPADLAALLVALSAFVFYLVLAWKNPVVYWGDAHVRLALHNQILLGHWLPLLQVLIWLVSTISNNLIFMRGFLAIIAASVLVNMYYFSKRVFSPLVGLVAMTLLAVNSIFVALSIVPYAEILFAGLVLLALNLLEPPTSRKRFVLGIIALNLACLTRYEGWLLVIVLMCESAVRSMRSSGGSRQTNTVKFYSIAPLAWLIFILLKPGSLGDEVKSVTEYVKVAMGNSSELRLLPFLNLDYLNSFTQAYLQLLRRQTGSLVILLGVLGWFIAVLKPELRTLSLRIAAFAMLVVFMWLLWFSVNVWEPQYFALRTAFVSELFLIFYASYGFEQLISAIFRWFSPLIQRRDILRLHASLLFGVVFLLSCFSALKAGKFVSQTAQEPDFYIPAQIGKWLNIHVSQQDAVWVLSDDPLQLYALATYTYLPLDSILDDRLDEQYIRQQVQLADRIYVVGLFRSPLGLSESESAILNGLEDRKIHAQTFVFSMRRVWVISSGDIRTLLAPQ